MTSNRPARLRDLTGLLLLSALLVGPCLPTSAQSRDLILHEARAIMEDVRYASHVTIGPDGHPQSRVVDPFPPDSAMVVWVATNPATRKVAQIRADPRVTMSYVDPSGAGYVTLLGRAEEVDDPAIRRAHFKPGWSTLWPDGPDGQDFMLLRVLPVRVEVVSYGAGVVGDAVTWLPPAVDFE